MALLNVQNITKTGLSPTFSAASSGGDSIQNDGKTVLHVKNASAAAVTVTVDSVAKCNHGFDHDLPVSIAAGGDQIFGPFDPHRFSDEFGKTNFTYSAATSVTVAALKMA